MGFGPIFMPIDYKKYPQNWKSEIRPRIISRSNNKCEMCGLANGEKVFSAKKGVKRKWFKTIHEATIWQPNEEMITYCGKWVKVVLTIAHLDHDESNPNVKDERLKAMCQLCHLKYDTKEKAKRILLKNSKNGNQLNLF
jgi:hypothetical protein